jgi:AraC-like DNA-binding protein/quercetin dioxygenase-like cupin family protein
MMRVAWPKEVHAMKIPVYRLHMDYPTRYSKINPFLLFAQKYEFAAAEASPLRTCYAHAVVLVESGRGTLRLGQETYALDPGSLIYIPAGAVHRWEAHASDPMVHRCVYFDWTYVNRPGFHRQRNYFARADSFNPELASPLPGLQLHAATRVNNIPLWVSYFNSLTPPPELLETRNPLEFLQYNGAFQTFLHHYLSFAVKTEAVYDLRIKKILERIDREPPWSGSRTIYQWARELGLKRSRFHELFKQDTGMTPHDYILSLQYRRIADDLCESDMTITEIARKHGYSSVHYFSRAFRNKMGMTPSEYRKKFR